MSSTPNFDGDWTETWTPTQRERYVKISDAWEDYIQQRPSQTATEAAKKLDDMFHQIRADAGDEEKEFQESDIFFGQTWDALIKLARFRPRHHFRLDMYALNQLVDMVKGLRDLPSDIVVTDIRGDEFRVWTDLPVLELTLDHQLSTFDHSTILDFGMEEARCEWRNINNFIARLIKEGVLLDPYYCLPALRAALENSPDPQDSAYHAQGHALDCYIPAAAEWFFLCGDRLALAVCRWQLRLESWLLWKQRFGEISTGDLGSERTRLMARYAGQHMQLLEAVEMENHRERSEAELAEQGGESIGPGV